MVGRVAGWCVVFVQAAVTAFALLIFGDAFEQVHAIEVGPEGGYDVDLSVGELPQEKVAEAHFATSADYEIGIGQVAGV